MTPDGRIAPLVGRARPTFSPGGFSGDGGPALEAELRYPDGVALAADGAVLVSDTGNGRVRRVGADGVIQTVAAGLREPRGLAGLPDGSILVAERGRVLRIAPDGTRAVVAGGGGLPVGRGGRRATDVRMDPVDVAPEQNGSVLIADRSGRRVLRATPDGRIAVPAGRVQDRLNRDGLPALRASLGFPVAAVASVGSSGFVVAQGYRVRLVVGRARPPLAVALLPRPGWRATAGGRLRVPYAITRRARVEVRVLRAAARADAPVVVGALTLRRAAGRARIGRNALTVGVPPRPGTYVLRLTATRADDGSVAVEQRRLTVARPRSGSG